MERVTHIDKDGWYINGANVATVFHSGTGEIRMRGKDIDRLAAYEETGLEPEKIEQLKGEVFGLKVDKQELDQAKRERRIIPKGYALVKLKLLEELDDFRSLGSIDRLRALAQADREGRCVVLPSDDYTWTIRGDIVRGIIKANCRAAKKEVEAALRREQDG